MKRICSAHGILCRNITIFFPFKASSLRLCASLSMDLLKCERTSSPARQQLVSRFSCIDRDTIMPLPGFVWVGTRCCGPENQHSKRRIDRLCLILRILNTHLLVFPTSASDHRMLGVPTQMSEDPQLLALVPRCYLFV